MFFRVTINRLLKQQCNQIIRLQNNPYKFQHQYRSTDSHTGQSSRSFTSVIQGGLDNRKLQSSDTRTLEYKQDSHFQTRSMASTNSTTGEKPEKQDGADSTSTSDTNSSTTGVKTAIVMMNMGGPESDHVDDVRKFLLALFKDTDIIKMPMQSILGPLIAKTRASKLKAKFDQIGGDPLKDWTEKQGKGMVEYLDKISPSTAPHKAYTCFRYSRPNIETAITNIEHDKVDNVILLSKYPQYSCSTTGSSLNEIARYCIENKIHGDAKPAQRWSLIDRWPVADAIVDVFVERIEKEMVNLTDEIRDQIIILFSAHSIPIWMVERGDDYTGEVGATVQAIMHKLKRKYPYSLVWQSKVGPVPWQGPKIEEALKGYVRNGHKHFMCVPVAFVNEHIETLHELDIEYGEDLRKEVRFETFIRIATPNDHPKFLEGLANIVKEHLDSKQTMSKQMTRRCPGCDKSNCKQTRSWLKNLSDIQKDDW